MNRNNQCRTCTSCKCKGNNASGARSEQSYLGMFSYKSDFSGGMNSCADNLTAVLYDVKDMRLEQKPVPQPKENEVLLRMESVGICGSDVHYLLNGRIGDFVLRAPMVIGHEASATVVEVGCRVKTLKPDDRVALEPGVPCRICNYCKTGRYNLCPGMQFCATPPYDGNLCRYYCHPEDFCVKLPPQVSLDEGALLEPLSVGVHACKKAGIKIGTTVLVLGCGPIGLVTFLTAKAFGASKIIITDIKDDRLKMATKLGVDHALKVCSSDKEEAVMQRIITTFGDQPDVTIECSGADFNIRLAVRVTKSGGRAVMVGMGKPEITVPLISALAREVDIIGCFRYCNDYRDALDLVANKKINVKALITHHFKIEDTIEAFNTAQNSSAKAIKIMIHPNRDWKSC